MIRKALLYFASIGAVGACAFEVAIPVDHQRSHPPVREPSRPTAARVNASPLRLAEFGTLRQVGNAQAAFSVANPGDSAITIARARTSCPCLDVQVTNSVVPAGSAVQGIARIDLSDEPDFAGGLRFEVEFLGEAGEVLFWGEVHAVVPHASPTDLQSGASGSAANGAGERFSEDRP